MKFYVERDTLIEADLEKVKPLIANFNNWSSWSPWNIIEPTCKMDIGGTPGEVGHKMSWDGEIIGAGTNTLAKHDGNTLTYDLEFLKPWKSKAVTSLSLSEEAGQTRVTWTMDGNMPFFMFFMIPMMKTWIGMDYDRGLRMMKEVAEKGSVNATTTNKGVVDKEGFSYVGISKTVPIKGIGEFMKKDFEKIIEDVVKERGLKAEHWVSLYPKFDMRGGQMTYIAAISDENLKDVDLGPEYQRGTIPSGKALEILHEGPYDFLGNGWSMGMMYLQAKKMKQGSIPFEQYWNSPLETAPEDLRTSIYFPLK